MTKRFESEPTAELGSVDAMPTESIEPAPLTAEAPAPGWGATPTWGAPMPRTEQPTAPLDDVDGVYAAPAYAGGYPPVEGAADDEPFVPAPRYRMGRFTKILVCVCLVLGGALGGSAIQKAVDLRTGTTGRANFSQFAPGAGTGGAGQNGPGGFGRNRATTAPGSGGTAPGGQSAGGN